MGKLILPYQLQRNRNPIGHTILRLRLARSEKRIPLTSQDTAINDMLDTLPQLTAAPVTPKRPMGFMTGEQKRGVVKTGAKASVREVGSMSLQTEAKRRMA